METLFFETSGFSMWPFLKAGERLIVKKVPLKTLNVGDIVLYRNSGLIACHRLVRRSKHGDKQLFYVRGDNAPGFLQVLDEESFLGKVGGVIKKDRVINFCTKTRGFINRIIVIIAPHISRINRFFEPYYHKFLNLHRPAT